MLMVGAALAAVWLIGAVLGASRAARLGMMGVIWALVVLSLAVLPDGPLRQALGGDLRIWLVLGGLVALGAAYRAGLAALRRRATPPPPQPGAEPAFRPAELDRYSRHILLREIGGPGQQRLKNARVLVIGAGGLGSPACLYLAAAGVGQITVVDADQVENSNLQRQIIHRDDRIGTSKAQSAADAMRAINPFIRVNAIESRIEAANAEALIDAHDLVLDGCDNFDTRYLVNSVAARLGRPLISAAMTQWEGQISLYHPAAGGACYECVFPTRPAPGMVPACAEAGVVAPLPGVIGAMMALEAVKHLTGAGQTLRNRLLIHDALFAQTRVIGTAPRPGCPACAAQRARPE